MGKIRTKIIGLDDVEEKQKKEASARREIKKQQKEKEAPSDEQKKEQVIVAESEKVEVKKATKKQTAEKKEAEEGKSSKRARKKVRGKKYREVSAKVNKNTSYPLAQAVDLLKKVHYAGFDETVELHFNLTNAGLKGSVLLPHGSGKEVRAVVATDELLAEIEKGKITFDVLVAHPSFMPKLVKHAKVLGPKGLMPNPKNGTVTDDPEGTIKKLKGGTINYKTEAKFPLMHQSVGKLSFKEEALVENVRAFIKSVSKNNIKSVFLKSSMSPSIRIDVEKV